MRLDRQSPDFHPRHDGTPRCDICSTEPGTDQGDWCPLTESILCDSCCARIARFDPAAIVEALERSTTRLTPGRILETCAECPRNPSAGGIRPSAAGSAPS